MKYILIRHGESEQNVGNANGMLDSNIPLTLHGVLQAERMSQYLYDNRELLDIDEHTMLFYSPYLRTRQTKDKIIEKNSCIHSCYEDILLSEIQCGDFTGYIMKQYCQVAPLEYKKFLNYKANNRRFWYKFPNGESPFDVSIRTQLFLQKLKSESSVIILSHVHVLKVLQMFLLQENLDWYEQERGMNNCEIRIFQKGRTLQYIQFEQ